MLDDGFSKEQVEKVTFNNPINFFAQSGRISIDMVRKPLIDQTQTFKDNKVLRGQEPIIEK